MIKLLGACFILLSTSAIGFRIARAYADRPRQIRRMRGALSLLQTEITYGSRRLDRICEQIAKREKDPVRSLYTRTAHYLKTLDGVSTFECWKRAVEETWPSTALKNPEKEVLIDFGKTLGISDREDQLSHLVRARTNLEVEESQAREEQMRYEKMCKSLGVLAGALIVILIY
ncbi:stage III sporulation protein AB [Melghirimyces profundicolus]|uniref:Stage III sporulation protein AB n=1 Tax=Melghirimyces profundicolus TaxID=1242148 RepID=A0A2T6BCZ8_9BACL|nr:stage III sporulation protein SpoIIIAB [Melghirimyces profundicolus]PTX53916.1 stage III sporulation protein AB [Melghirimyces profundicolus]